MAYNIIFKQIKLEWLNTIYEWASQPEIDNYVLRNATFCSLFNKVLSNETLKDSIKNDFRKCGHYHFDSNTVDYTKSVQNNLEKIKASVTSTNKSPTKTLKTTEFDTASNIIKRFNNDLTARGESVKVLLQV